MSTPLVVSHLQAAAEQLKLARRINETAPAPVERRNSLDNRLAALEQAMDRTLRQASSISRAVQESQRSASRRGGVA